MRGWVPRSPWQFQYRVWLTHGFPPGSRVTQVEARETRFELGGGI